MSLVSVLGLNLLLTVDILLNKLIQCSPEFIMDSGVLFFKSANANSFRIYILEGISRINYGRFNICAQA